MLLLLALAGCHEKKEEVDPAHFTEFSSEPGSEPGTVRLNFHCEGGPANHVFVEFDPDGASGFRQADINDDGVLDESDQIDPTLESVEFPVPAEITNFDNALFRMVAVDSAGNIIGASDAIGVTDVVVETIITYVKASNPDFEDRFGRVALSTDGTTLAVGAASENSAATGIDGDQSDNSADRAGAVYVFTRTVDGWSQQAYIKASNTDAVDFFGVRVALSDGGDTLAVGASGEDSAATGINGDETDNSATDAGAVYVFVRAEGGWSQQAYIKASNTDAGDGFGAHGIALSGDGTTLAVGARFEDSAATGINGLEAEFDNSASIAGAVYVFIRDVQFGWSQEAYVKASNTDAGDIFGTSVALSDGGNTLAVGAMFEDSAATGINGDETDNSASAAGAVYVFTRDVEIGWSQQAYIKASNPDAGDRFGVSTALSSDGTTTTLAVGAEDEDSAAIGVGSDQSGNSATDAGAAYVFTRMAESWSQQAYIKASNTEAGDTFGRNVALADSGDTLAIGAPLEDSAATGPNGDEIDNSATDAGAAYLFTRSSQSWSQQAYIKASNTDADDRFGGGLLSESVALADGGNPLAVGALLEDSAATGIDGDETDNSLSSAGAVYLFSR